jgi:hypothetical protein
MTTINLDQRQWTHEELPEARPSAAAYRLGCRCAECSTAHAAYQAAWRARRVQNEERTDGTPEYHNHQGKPSPTTARRWGCAQASCLAMAGLYLDPMGVVRRFVDDEVDPAFGETPAATA